MNPAMQALARISHQSPSFFDYRPNQGGRGRNSPFESRQGTADRMNATDSRMDCEIRAFWLVCGRARAFGSPTESQSLSALRRCEAERARPRTGIRQQLPLPRGDAHCRRDFQKPHPERRALAYAVPASARRRNACRCASENEEQYCWSFPRLRMRFVISHSCLFC